MIDGLPFLSVDSNDTVHVDIPGMLAYMGMDDTLENRDRMAATVAQAIRRAEPDMKIIGTNYGGLQN